MFRNHFAWKAVLCWFVVLGIGAISPVALAASYDEAISGDLSNDRQSPTTITLDLGQNLVNGSFGMSPVPGVADLDYLTVIVPVGFQLDALQLVSLNHGGSNSFLGIQSGPVFTLPPTATDPTPLLGWSHVFKSQEGSNLLPAMGLGSSLAAASYTLWVNETDTSEAWSYGLNFNVTAVPEPDIGILMFAGFALIACLRWRR